MFTLDPLSVAFLTVLALFTLRGAMLGFAALISRLFGLLAGYTVAYSFRTDLARFAHQQWLPDLPVLVLTVIASLLLFLSGMAIVNLAVKLVILFLRKAIPVLNEKLANKTWEGRAAGATINAFIGSVLFLLLLWGYQLASSVMPLPQIPPTNSNLPQLANFLGGKIIHMTDSQAMLNQYVYSLPDTSSSREIRVKQFRQQVLSMSSRFAENLSSTGNDIVDIEALPIADIEDLDVANYQSLAEAQGLQQFAAAAESLQAGYSDNAPSIEQLMRSEQFQDMLKNPEVQQQLQENFESMLQDRETMQNMLEQVLPGQSDNPHLQALMDNPAAQQVMTQQFQFFLDNPEMIKRVIDSPQGQAMLERFSQ